jgi:hypothetical protein
MQRGGREAARYSMFYAFRQYNAKKSPHESGQNKTWTDAPIGADEFTINMVKINSNSLLS